MTDETAKHMKDWLNEIYQVASNPTYNGLEVGFRHSPLTKAEIEERLRGALETIKEYAERGLTPLS